MEDIVYKLDGVAQILRGFSGNPECQQAGAMDIAADARIEADNYQAQKEAEFAAE